MRLVLMLWALGCGTRVPPPADPPAEDPTAAWGAALTAAIRPDGVDWGLLAQRREPLERYLAWAAVHGPETDLIKESQERLRHAFLINTHNALVVWRRLEGDPWAEEIYNTHLFRVDEEWIALQRLGRDRVAARFQNAYAWAGLYLGTLDGPPLRWWEAETLKRDLPVALDAWLASPRGLRPDGDGYQLSPRLAAHEKDFRDWAGYPNRCALVAARGPEAARPWFDARIQRCEVPSFAEDWTREP